MKAESPFLYPFKGFVFFLSKPKLWPLPLLAVLFSWMILFAVGIYVAYIFWPSAPMNFGYASYKIFRALGFASLAALGTWVFIFPLFLNFCFEKLLKKVFLAKGAYLEPLSFHKSLLSSLWVFKKTFFIRIFWLGLSLFTAFTFGPFSILLSQMAIAHLAFIDGMDLSLSLLGKDVDTKIRILSRQKASIFWAGILSGLFSFFLIPTFIVWIFWIPSVYVGASLYIQETFGAS